MKVAEGMKSQYPKLSTWICDNLPKAKTKTKVFAAFQKYAELSEAAATTALTLGTNPIINYRHMVGANGEFEGGTDPETVFLAKEICEKFEKSETDRKDLRMHCLVESTLLHEIVHWGDWKDGVDQAGEEGKDFEVAAYGKDIDRYW